VPELPTGTVTLLFTDIEGSTRLLQELGRERYVDALSDQRRIVRGAFTRNGGVEVEMQGDSFHFAFAEAHEAVAAAAAAQKALADIAWFGMRAVDTRGARAARGEGARAYAEKGQFGAPFGPGFAVTAVVYGDSSSSLGRRRW
jgi:class 3 adenylate cyclase